MRPIKFRGFGSKKLFSEEKWYYGNLLIVCGEYGIHPPLLQLTDLVIPETVGQFTGCYDADGEEIYEGDIVRTAMGSIGVIEFGNKGNFGIKWQSIDLKDWLRDMDREFIEDCQVKIIGNIHDNPELVQE